MEIKSAPSAPASIAQTAPEPKVASKAEPKDPPKAEPKSDTKPSAKLDDGAKVLALLEGKGADPVAGLRFVVQVGAFAEAARAKDTRSKLESAGLKTYTQVVETKEGQRTRVRIGPFADKVEADKVVAKIKALGLNASVLSL